VRYSKTKSTKAKKKKEKLAVTAYKATGKKKKRSKSPKATITITVYEGLFEKSPQTIYSALYHEFIHVAQRTRETDETGTESTDEYMHEPQKPTKFDKKIMSPLQEIETHVREIEHADETGITKSDPKYYRETWLYLIGYSRGLLNIISQNHERLPFWKGYIKRALTLLKQLLGSSELRIKNDLQQNDLEETNTTNEKVLTDLVNKIQSVYDTIPDPT
jgi:hypothetical protein